MSKDNSPYYVILDIDTESYKDLLYNAYEYKNINLIA